LFWLVLLVVSENQRHTGRLGVTDRFLGLWHDAVVISDNDNNNVSSLGTACTHCRKGSVARGIEERDHALVSFYVVCTDMLGNAASFARRYLGATNVVEQRGLAMVNVAHDGDHRRTRLRLALVMHHAGQIILQRFF